MALSVMLDCWNETSLACVLHTVSIFSICWIMLGC